jgi:hypothetical protein
VFIWSVAERFLFIPLTHQFLVADPESVSLLMLDDFINDAMFSIEKPSLFDTISEDIDHEAMFRMEFTLSSQALHWEVARIAAVIQNKEYANEQSLQETITDVIKALDSAIRDDVVGSSRPV